MMNRVVLFAVLLTSAAHVAEAVTKVAVMELGRKGAVRRTTSQSVETTVAGVASFWNALHAPGRKLQHAGMTVVPDLFSRPDSGVVIGLSGAGVDLDEMPLLNSLLSQEGSSGVVGHMEIVGCHCDALMSKLNDVEKVESPMAQSVEKHMEKKGLSGVKAVVDETNASSVDKELTAMLLDLDTKAKSEGKSIVIHLVVEENEASSTRRKLSSRRLANADDDGNNNNAEEGNGNNNGNNADGNQYNGYYGYGYYNAYGEWVTPYKTMFQIQYFNVVLWTSLGLTLVLFSTIYLMMYMPLEPDTLLFGESAKMVGDD